MYEIAAAWIAKESSSVLFREGSVHLFKKFFGSSTDQLFSQCLSEIFLNIQSGINREHYSHLQSAHDLLQYGLNSKDERFYIQAIEKFVFCSNYPLDGVSLEERNKFISSAFCGISFASYLIGNQEVSKDYFAKASSVNLIIVQEYFGSEIVKSMIKSDLFDVHGLHQKQIPDRNSTPRNNIEIAKKLISDHLDVDIRTINGNTNLYHDLGADSLDTVELVMAFEEEFGLELSDDLVRHIETVGEIVELMKVLEN